MTVEECVYWLAVVNSLADDMVGIYARVAIRKIVARAGLRGLMSTVLSSARVWNQPPSDGEHVRVLLVTWALCREAARAVERERAGRVPR